MLGVIVGALIGGIILLFILNRWKLTYWERKGIPQLNPKPLFGDLLRVLTCKISLGQLYEEIYFKSTNEKYVGMYELYKPTLLVKDIELVEKILVRDFNTFINRGLPSSQSNSDVDKGLPILDDGEWRAVRYKLIPAFSSGKLKNMYEIMKQCSERVLAYMDSNSKIDVDVKDVSTRYALDVIASCGFGIDATKDMDKNSKLRVMGEKILNLGTIEYYAFLFVMFLPNVASKFGLTMTPGETGVYFGNIIRQTMSLRESSKIKRNDFIDLLLQLKLKGSIEVQHKDPDDNYLKLDYEPTTENIEMTDQILISQAFTFFSAGFDGLSSPMTCILYEIAKNSKVQDKVRQDIQDQIDKYGGLTYEALKNAKYLDCCIQEGLRLYPLSNFVTRESKSEYELEPGVKIDAGTKVVICNMASQVDPAYYPDPLVYNPDRFDGRLNASMSDFSYLPFGAGPRICIGLRFSQLVMKLGLATILTNYSIKLSPKAPKTIKMKVKTFFASQPEDMIYFNVTKIK